MRALLIFSILGALTGCSNSGPTLPTCTVPEVAVSAQPGIDVPPMPEEVGFTPETVTFDQKGLQQLERVRIAGKANKEIADKNAEALDARAEEINALRVCNEQQILWMEMRDEQLKDEKREHAQDNWFHRGLLILGGLIWASQN